MSAFVPLHSAIFVGTPSLVARYYDRLITGGIIMPIVLWLLGVPISLIVVAALFGAF
jgi:hypothetical protein